jgi:hypothetical protein
LNSCRGVAELVRITTNFDAKDVPQFMLLLGGVKRTWSFAAHMSPFDPKRMRELGEIAARHSTFMTASIGTILNLVLGEFPKVQLTNRAI